MDNCEICCSVLTVSNGLEKMPYKDQLRCCLHSVVLVIASYNCS